MTLLHPYALLLLPLCALPFWLESAEGQTYSWIGMVPPDAFSKTAHRLLKTLTALLLLGIILAMSAPKGVDQKLEKSGKGAQSVLVIDRSVSMEHPFAGNAASGNAAEVKSAAARRIISQFIDSRPDDMMGVVGFSNSALYGSKITPNREAIHAAIAAATSGGINQTNIGAGLTQAVALFDSIQSSGARALILLSDGAGKISPRVKQRIQESLEQRDINLYWIVIRDPNDVSIFQKERVFEPGTEPAALALDTFFRTLNIKYRAYEADNANALQSAINDIDSREKRAIKYSMSTPGHDYSTDLIMVDLVLGLMLLAARNLRLYA